MSHPVRHKAAWSLRKRLVLAFGVMLILFLGLAGFVLDRAYKESVAAAVQERLQLQIYALLGVAEPDERGFFLPELVDARFSHIDSGLYGLIIDRDGEIVWLSPSALNLDVDPALFSLSDQQTGDTIYGSIALEPQGELAWASYGIYWEDQDQTYSFIVMESTAPTAAEIREFQSSLYLWFGALAVFLSIAQYLLLRWGMRPLQALAEDVSAIESGRRDKLQGSYPSELQSVSENLNLLISSERQRQSRYRTTLGDLAHSLKTPLAVLSTAVQESRQGGGADNAHLDEMAEQLSRMDEIVSYQLKRAVKSNQPALLAKPVAVEPVVSRLLSALSKVYRDKDMQVSTDIATDAQFLGEESDLMELAGNLLDNAFKYGSSRIAVAVRQESGSLLLEVCDDGDGIDEQNVEWVLQRGARADTVASGQGIGLAVAVDIVSAYQGEIKVSRSEWGGACFQVRFFPPLG